MKHQSELLCLLIFTLFIVEGFEFIDDIHWVKPEGAGWATGRGRRFAADRNPLQYKAVPVTEYVLVYRKKTDKLIDWHIRKHPDQKAVEASKIGDGYEKTNLWKIHPANHPKHPAVFPLELAEKAIQYYSFKNDVILDPFAGTGTTLIVAKQLQRNSIGVELNPTNVSVIKDRVSNLLKSDNILNFRKDYACTENLDNIWQVTENSQIPLPKTSKEGTLFLDF